MSDSGGTDNPAFSNSDEYPAASTNVEDSQTLEQEQKDQLHMGNGSSFVSQDYVEPTQDPPEAQYKTEMKIKIPNEGDKTSNTVKTNGINGNGNNNDLSFLNSSITSSQINDGKKEQIEAVNLELVSMRPYTGNNLQTKGQEACEIPSDPYEEYFVPVNEHRKYIRGEKLYVTKDKRSKSSYWRRIACWGFGLSVLAVALIIAILAATGIILTQEATQPLDNEHQRSLDDINTAGSQEFIKNPPSSPPPETSTFPPWRTTDETMLKTVDNALEGSIWLDNLVWNDDLMDVKTRIYRDVASEIENSLSNMIDTEETKTMIKIYNITEKGQVMFRIGNPPIDQPDLLQERIEKMLRKNGSMIGKYHLSRMSVKHLIDECQYENLNCSELCKFDYDVSIFTCACFPGRVFDSMGVNCIDESDLSDVDMAAEEPKSAIQDVIQGRGRAPEQSFEPERDHDQWMNHHYHYDNGGSFTDSSVEKKDETSLKTMLTMNEEPKYELEPNDEPKSPSSWDTNVEHKLKVETTSEPIAKSESTFNSNMEPKSEPMPVSESNPEQEPEMPMIFNTEPNFDQEPKLESTVEPRFGQEQPPELTTKPNLKLDSEPESKVESIPTIDTEPKVDLEPTPEILEHDIEPKMPLEPTSDSPLEHDIEPKMPLEPTSEPLEHEIEPEMPLEPTSEPLEHDIEPKMPLEPTSEPLEHEIEPKMPLEPTSEIMIEHDIEPKMPLEPTPEILEHDIEPKMPLEPTPESPFKDDIEPKMPLEPTSETLAHDIEPEMPLESTPKSLERDIEPKIPLEPTSKPLEQDIEPKMPLEPTSEIMIEHNIEPEFSLESTTEPAVKQNIEPEPIKPEEKLATPNDSDLVSNRTAPGLETYLQSNLTMNSSLLSDVETTMRSNTHIDNFESTPMADIADLTTFVPTEVQPTESIMKFNLESKVEKESTMKPDNLAQFDITTEIDENTNPTTDSVTELMMDSNFTTESVEKHIESSPVPLITPDPLSSSTPDLPTEPVIISEMIPETTETLPTKMEVLENFEPSSNISELFSGLTTMNITNETEIDLKLPMNPLPVIPLITLDSVNQQDDLTNVTEVSTTMMTETIHSDISDSGEEFTNQTSIQDSNSLNSIDSTHELHLPKEPQEITEKSELMNEPIINSTQSWMINDTNIPPQLIPEKIDPYVLIRNALKMASSTESIESIPDSLIHEIISPAENEKSIEIPSTIEEKNIENMSPFLPVIIREKDSSKKAPRLDKDEQDFPNPFEPHVEDVIIHHQITPSADVNGTEFTDVANKPHLSHDVYQTETSHQENTTETTTSTSSPFLMTQIDLTTTMLSNIDEEKPVPIDTEMSDIDDKHMDMEVTDIENINDTQHNNENMEEITSTTMEPTTTYMNEQMFEITTSKPPMPVEPLATINNNDDNSKLQNKFEDNTFEDQYNDITEERISKKIDSTSNLKKKNLLASKSDFKSTTLKNIETTPIMEEIESTTITESNVNIEKITEMTPEMSTEKPKDDARFTTEIPIMPVEIQQDISTTEVIEKTESSMVNNSASMIADLSKTIYPMLMLETKTTAQIPILPEEFSTTEMSTKMSTSNESKASTTVETSTVSFDHIKPVSEVIIDDPEPETFSHAHFLPKTTELMPVDEVKEDSEEKLKIIPLESDTVDDTSINTTPSTMQTIFILNDMPKKIKEDTPTVSKLKITEITSASQQSQSENHPNQVINNTMLMKNHSVPEIIPVYETIEDDVENPLIHPKNILQLQNMSINHQHNDTEMNNTTLKTILNDNHPMYSKCNVGQFQCINGTSRDGAYCVSLSSKCDSENDCSDASDEINCETEGCPGNFQCKNRQCLGRHLVCNGIADCDDGSDEHNCQDWTCHFDEFKCPSGRCIPDLWRCNGRPDCEDHRDEYSCSKSCSNDEYLCPSENWCVPQTWRCNGIIECINGEDEKLCDCGLEQFKCETGGCIALQQVCDGIMHCPDHSDEWDCLITNMTLMKNDDENDTISIGQPVLLKIKHYDGNRHLVCSDNWTRHHSDIYCKSLGYVGSETVETVKYEDTQKQILRLKENYQDTISLAGNLELTDNCESNEYIKISCQEFSCGSSENEGPTARLIGGTPAGDGQWSSVALLKELKSGAVCTASVLGPLHAIASYSCIHNHRHSGSWEMLTGRDLQKSGKVKSIIPYPQVKYNQFLYNDDIALIQLETPLTLSRNLSAICLPSQQFQETALCVTAGWGFPTSGEVNLKLKFLPVPIYKTEECNATSHYAGFITKNNICARFTGTDKGTCYNDEGAPLICASETGRWEIQGLLSHHSRCSRHHPAIFSSLSPVISWLQHSVPALQTRL